MRRVTAVGFIFTATSLCAFGINSKCCDPSRQPVEQAVPARRAGQAVSRHSQLHYHLYGLFVCLPPLSEIRHTTLIRNTTLLLVLKRLISLCLSAVPGVWYAAHPGRETQKVSGVSWGVCVRRPEPLFGHCLHVPAPAAAHRPLPLTQHARTHIP